MNARVTTFSLAAVALFGVVAIQMGLVESIEALVDFLNTVLEFLTSTSE